MMIFKLVNERKLVRVDNDAVAAGTTKLYAIFELSDSFTGTIRSYWRREDTDQTYDVVLEEDGSCLVPWEVLAKTEYAPPWPYTYDHTVVVSLADTSRVTSTECEIKVETSSYSEETENTSPTPSTGGGGTAEVTAESIEKALGYKPANADEIPANISQLNNDSGYITKLVSDLANYYTKSQTYTRDEVNAKISAIPKFNIQVVSSLPTSNISTTTVYLLKSGEESDNLYTEYIYVDGAWEYLGRQTVDLSGYALKTDIPTKISQLSNDANYVTQTALNNALAGYAPKATTLAGYGITDGATKEQIEKINNEKADKTALTLGIASDGLIYLFVDGEPVGTGIPQGQSGDVFGYVAENNVIVLSGDLPDGTYTFKYEMDNGTLVNIGSPTLDSNVYYTVTNTLTNCTNSNSAETVAEGGSYSATITANDGYALSSVTVTMGGSAVSVTNGVISIASVTGDIVITAVAEEAQASYTNLLTLPEIGYKTGYRLSVSSGEAAQEGCEVTGYIPVTMNDVLRIKNISTGSDSYNLLFYYDSSKTRLDSDHTATIFTIDEGNGVYSSSWYRTIANTAYIRFGSENIDDTSIVTINEEIV